MMRFLLRLLGFILAAVAFAALVVDGTRSIAGGRLLQYSIGDAAAWLGGAHDAAVLASAARLPPAARPLVAGLLAAPVWVVAGLLGLMLLYAGRRPAPDFGFSSRRS